MFYMVAIYSWNSLWPTPDVQNNVFAGFLDPENMGLAIGIAFLSACDPML